MDMPVTIEQDGQIILDEVFVFTSTDREVLRSELTEILNQMIGRSEDDFRPGDSAVIDLGNGYEYFVLDCAFNSTVELIDP